MRETARRRPQPDVSFVCVLLAATQDQLAHKQSAARRGASLVDGLAVGAQGSTQ